MKICIVHNEYGRKSGEEIIVANIKELLIENDHEVIHFSRSSAELDDMWLGKTRAFMSGIYSHASIKAFKNLVIKENPDIIHVHNVFPFISPAILTVCKDLGVPVVMTVHNYRLICPTGLFLRNGKNCEKCSGGKEYNCIRYNCENSYFKSIGYAVRNYVARRKRYFIDNITLFACLTEFQKNKLVNEGYPEDKLRVIPNVSDLNKEDMDLPGQSGDYVAFIGRMSAEKGIDLLINASKELTDIPFKAAGSIERMPEVTDLVGPNFEFTGYLNSDDLHHFTQQSKIVVLPTFCYEGFPTVLIEAMLHEKPVVCSRIGGLPEIVSDGVTGLLFEPGNAEEFVNKIKYLCENPDVCSAMGKAGRQKALAHYSSKHYYDSVMKLYNEAIKINTRPPIHKNGILNP